MSAQLLHLSHHYHDPLGGHHMDTAPTLTKAERRILDRLERDLSDARKLRALEIWS